MNNQNDNSPNAKPEWTRVMMWGKTLGDHWEQDRKDLLNALGGTAREQVQQYLYNAAHAAQTQDLKAAACWIEEARRVMVGLNVFRCWDNGIWVFAGVIKVIRMMSAEEKVPWKYRRLLKAIPSARIDSHMTCRQIAFWYGKRWWESGSIYNQ